MFGWFKKKHQQDKSSLPESIERMMMTKSLATAIADSVSSYSKDVQDGKLLPTPAYKHVDDYSIVDMWHFTRLEALSHLYGHRGSDVLLLAEPPTQKKIAASGKVKARQLFHEKIFLGNVFSTE